MFSLSNSFQSTALVVYEPQEHPFAKVKAHLQKMQNLFFERSFKTQLYDSQFFNKFYFNGSNTHF